MGKSGSSACGRPTPGRGDRAENPEQRILVVDPVNDQTRLVSAADLYVYQYDWSPDDSRFAVTAAHEPGDDNWYVAGLYVSVKSSSRTRRQD